MVKDFTQSLSRHPRRAVPQSPTNDEVTLLKVENEQLKKMIINLNDQIVALEEFKTKSNLPNEINALKREVKELKSNPLIINPKRALTKNEEKLLNAIRSEQENQKTEWPIISTSLMRKTYKVHPAYFAASLEQLVSSKQIEREEISYSGNTPTYKYTLLL